MQTCPRCQLLKQGLWGSHCPEEGVLTQSKGPGCLLEGVAGSLHREEPVLGRKVGASQEEVRSSGGHGRLALSCLLAVRIEETWRLWQKFLDDYSRFEDWLTSAERTAASPNSSEVLYTVAKEELKRFEV